MMRYDIGLKWEEYHDNDYCDMCTIICSIKGFLSIHKAF